MVGPVKEQEVSVISVITGTCPHRACSQRLLFLTITSTTLRFLVPPSNFLLSVPYVIITRAVHRRRMDFIKLRCLLHIQGYMDTLAAQKGNNLPCIPQERKMLWLRKDHKKITPLYVLLHQFVLCCNVGRNQFFPQTSNKSGKAGVSEAKQKQKSMWSEVKKTWIWIQPPPHGKCWPLGRELNSSESVFRFVNWELQ